MLVQPRERCVRKDNGSRKRKTTGAAIRNNRDCSLAPCLPRLPCPGITWGSLKNTRYLAPTHCDSAGRGYGGDGAWRWVFPPPLVILTCSTVWEPLPSAARAFPSQWHLRDLSVPTCIASEAASAGWLGNFGSHVQITGNEAHC